MVVHETLVAETETFENFLETRPRRCLPRPRNIIPLYRFFRSILTNKQQDRFAWTLATLESRLSDLAISNLKKWAHSSRRVRIPVHIRVILWIKRVGPSLA